MPPDNLKSSPEAVRQAEAPAIAITATFTAEALEPALTFWVRELGWDLAIRFAPYSQVFQQFLDPAGLLARNRGGVNIALVRLEDWARFDGQRCLELLEENIRHFVDALQAAAAFPSPLVVALCPASPAFLAEPGHAGFLARAEESLAVAVAGFSTVFLIRPAELERLYPVAQPHDPHGDELGHIPYTPEYFAALATLLARRIHALRTQPYKAIALDCDETLWAGICGEDGPQGVVIDPPRSALQEFMLARRREGMLLCLASKNNEEDVLDTFRAHPNMPLGLGDFVSRRIDWESKAANVAALAEDLDLALDSFVFIDDNPKECDEVASGCPDVLALALPADPAEIPAFLDHIWAFDRLRVTDEDRDRTALYAQQAERSRLERQSASLQEFLAALKLEVRIGPAGDGELPRIAQLTQRTNQMNVAAVRLGEAEIRQLLRSGTECLAVHVSDRFGSYGLTGAVIFRTKADVLAVDTFLLSCRALGRGVEHRMLAALGELALSRDKSRVDVPFVASARNRPALLFLESVGLEFREAAGDNCMFRFPARHAEAITYRPSSAPPRQRPPAATATRAERRKIDYARIASELRDPRCVLALIRERAGAAAKVFEHSAAPRTELEASLAAIWKELLNVREIGVHDNFFDLGGHSLLAVQLLSRVRQDFGVDLSLEVVYSGEFTIAELAKAMELKEIEQAGGADYQALVAQLENLSDDEVRALLAEEEARGGAAS